ncbi:hypothetical protein BC936DRAFT_142227 [Jimgerdemannia flammicorona]|uniref:Uncharacterized protein n=2 Tax=Jimgerdemannia flammicorona TaxID=994334 RepID=A0A433PQ99_9FUNG|nr:hypothetical protein BC936DRAFT_142227 [Jimgerdemannia flammicorona]RUS19635.1 hypothetical protein BC938DRAFT_475692 [Jimgerdemannia flammicorona]
MTHPAETISHGEDVTHMLKQLIQLLVVADGKLQMTRDDTLLVVVAGSVAGQLDDFRGEVYMCCTFKLKL